VDPFLVSVIWVNCPLTGSDSVIVAGT